MHTAGSFQRQTGQKGKLYENIKFCLHCLSLSSGLFQYELYKRHILIDVLKLSYSMLMNLTDLINLCLL